jgi:hypothetical protein
MNGANFIAVRRIHTKGNVTLAAVGATCERVPVEALAGLEARGAIQRAVPQPVAEDAHADSPGHYLEPEEAVESDAEPATKSRRKPRASKDVAEQEGE